MCGRRWTCCMSTAWTMAIIPCNDPKLVERLVAEHMTLTVCPLSNLKLCVVKDLKDHPLRKMLQLGLRATVNSDDPAYFGGTVNDNFRAVTAALDLDEGGTGDAGAEQLSGLVPVRAGKGAAHRGDRRICGRSPDIEENLWPEQSAQSSARSFSKRMKMVSGCH